MSLLLIPGPDLANLLILILSFGILFPAPGMIFVVPTGTEPWSETAQAAGSFIKDSSNAIKNVYWCQKSVML